MYEYSNREYLAMVRFYILSGENLNGARRMYAEEEHLQLLRRNGIPAPQIPSTSLILRTYQRLLDHGQFQLPSHARGRGRPPLSREVEDSILDYFERHPRRSTRQAARRFGVSQYVVWKLLHSMDMHPYHFSPVQALHAPDPGPRMEFCHWLHNHAEANILWSDESIFTRVGIYNVHNEHWWSFQNPHKIKEHAHQVRFSVNVWAAIIHDRIIGPVWIEGRLTGITYLQMIRSVIEAMLQDVPLSYRQDMYFQHDGCPAHYERSVRAYLNSQFGDKWIGRGGPVNWPPRSPDLTPLDFYLWAELKRLVYTEEAQSVSDLKQRIMDAFNVLKSDRGTLRSLSNNLQRRASLCLERNGGHFEQLLRYR